MTSVDTVPCPAWMTVIRGAHTNQAQPYGIPPCSHRARNLFQIVYIEMKISILTNFDKLSTTHPDHMVFLLMRRFENLAPVGSVYVV